MKYLFLIIIAMLILTIKKILGYETADWVILICVSFILPLFVAISSRIIVITLVFIINLLQIIKEFF